MNEALEELLAELKAINATLTEANNTLKEITNELGI